MRFSPALSKFLLVGCIVGAAAPAMFAQEEGNRPGRGQGPGGPGGGRGMRMGGMGMGGGLGGLIMMKEVREELKVDDDQVKELDASVEEIRNEMRSLFQPGSPPDMTKMRDLQTKSEGKLEEILDPKQMDRLLGLLIQRDGVRSVNSAILAKRLEVTEDQKAKMADVEKAAGEAMRSMFTGGPPSPENMEKFQTMRKENDAKLEAILTADQKSKMDSMKGEKFEFPAPQFGPGGPGGPGGGRGGRGGRPGQGA